MTSAHDIFNEYWTCIIPIVVISLLCCCYCKQKCNKSRKLQMVEDKPPEYDSIITVEYHS